MLNFEVGKHFETPLMETVTITGKVMLEKHLPGGVNFFKEFGTIFFFVILGLNYLVINIITTTKNLYNC